MAHAALTTAEKQELTRAIEQGCTHFDVATWMNSLFRKHGYVITPGYVHTATAMHVLLIDAQLDVEGLSTGVLVDLLPPQFTHCSRDEAMRRLCEAPPPDPSLIQCVLHKHGFVYRERVRLHRPDDETHPALFCTIDDDVCFQLDDLPEAMLADMYDRMVQDPRDRRRVDRSNALVIPMPVVAKKEDTELPLPFESARAIADIYRADVSRRMYTYGGKMYNRFDLLFKMLRNHGFRARPGNAHLLCDVRKRGHPDVSLEDFDLHALPNPMQHELYYVLIYKPNMRTTERRQARELDLAVEAMGRMKRRREEDGM